MAVTDPRTPPDLDAIAARHQLDPFVPATCYDCDRPWPCDASLLLAEVAALSERVGVLEGALRELVNQLDVVHASPEYRDVWFIARNHSRDDYRGPTYTLQLDRARDLLAPEGKTQENAEPT